MELKRTYCTTRKQSRRLFDLGLNPDTSDMYYDLSYSCQTPFIGDYPLKGMEIYNPNCIQAAWSLHRLIDLFPCLVEKKQCGRNTTLFLYFSLEKGLVIVFYNR